MKKIKRVLAVVLSAVMITAFPVSAHAEEGNSGREYIVIGENDTDVLLNNNCKLGRDILGNGHALEYGDVVEIENATILLTTPGQFAFNGKDSVKYIGTVSEVYKDSIKELTVTNIPSDTPIELTDNEGNIYTWSSIAGFNYKLMGQKGFEYKITPDDVNVGDVLSCAVEDKNGSNGSVIHAVSVLSKAASDLKGDTDLAKSEDSTDPVMKIERTLSGDADLNGAVDLADITVIAKYNLSNKGFPFKNPTAYYNADMNGDGVVNGLDTCALIENQLGRRKPAPKKDYTFEDFLNMSEEEIKAAFTENGFDPDTDGSIVWTPKEVENTEESGVIYIKLRPEPFMTNLTDHELISRSTDIDELFNEGDVEWDTDKIEAALALPKDLFTLNKNIRLDRMEKSGEDGNMYCHNYCTCRIECTAKDEKENNRLLSAALNYVQFNPNVEGFRFDWIGA